MIARVATHPSMPQPIAPTHSYPKQTPCYTSSPNNPRPYSPLKQHYTPNNTSYAPLPNTEPKLLTETLPPTPSTQHISPQRLALPATNAVAPQSQRNPVTTDDINAADLAYDHPTKTLFNHQAPYLHNSLDTNDHLQNTHTDTAADTTREKMADDRPSTSSARGRRNAQKIPQGRMLLLPHHQRPTRSHPTPRP
jgi:hypothetical protein